MTDDPVAELIVQHGLPPAYRQVVGQYWRPLADEIARRTDRKKPLIVGINGAQGSGKSTLCAFLEVLLDEHGLKAATLSLDDLYLGKADRQRLAREVHPLFVTRGVPGTHAPARGLAIFDDLGAGRDLNLPRFDKGTDEQSNGSERITGPVDVLLFEGWCVGCPPQADEDLLAPVNALEADEDAEGVWRSVATASSRSMTFGTVSEMAIVPDSECSTPTLMVSWAWASVVKPAAAMASVVADRVLPNWRRVVLMGLSSGRGG